MKRACKLLVNASKLQTERDRLAAEKQDKMMSMLEDMQDTIMRISCNADMKKKVQIADYFPIKSDSDVERFLEKSDGLFPEKRDGFESLVYCNVTKNLKLKRPFEATLLSTVFSRDFISSHRWPVPRYSLLDL